MKYERHKPFSRQHTQMAQRQYSWLLKRDSLATIMVGAQSMPNVALPTLRSGNKRAS